MILLLRLVSLLFLWGHAWYYFHTLLNFEFLLVSFFLAGVIPWVLFRFKVRGSLSAAVLVLFPHLLRFLLVGIALGLAGSAPSPWDEIPFLIDKNWGPAFLLFLLVSTLNWAYLTHKSFVVWERVLALGLVGLVFWAQGFFQNAGEQPLVKALLTGVFMLCETAILYLHLHKKDQGGKKAGSLSPSGEKKIWKVSKAIAGIGLVVVLLSLLFFRHQDSAVLAGGGLLKPNLFDMDFSEVVELESEISLNKDLVLLYKEEGPPELRYLRRMILSGYSSERGFFMDTPPDESFEERNLSNRGRKILWDDPGFLDRTLVKQEYYLVNLDPSSVLTLNQPLRFVPHVKNPSSSFKSSFSVESLVSHALFWEPAEKLVFPQSESWMTYYTRYGQDKKIYELAETLTRGQSTSYDKVYTIYLFLKNEYFYSLRPGVSATGRQLHHFLFESKKGYCTYFAYAMTLMLRSLGIPSRVAVGFFTRPDQTMLNFYPVLGNQAHAWVEVWFDDRGWIQYDPTSSTPAPGEELPASDMDWSANLVNLVTEALQVTPEPTGLGPDEGALDEDFSPSRVFLLALILVGLSGAMYLICYYGFFLRVRCGGNGRQSAAWSWSLLSRFISAAGYKREGGESVETYWNRAWNPEVLEEGAKKASRVYLEAFYGPREKGIGSQEIWRFHGQLQKSLAPRISWLKRLWIFLVPFWPRGFS